MSRLNATNRKARAKTFRRDDVLNALLRLAAASCVGIIVLIILFVASESTPALRQIGLHRFVTDQSWHPTAGQYKMLPMVVGTLAATAGSLLITGPLGVGAAVFLRYYAPLVIRPGFRRVLELLAGVPSVVYGLWGLTTLVPWIATFSPIGQGQSLLAGILILCMMTLPSVALAADAALGAVPGSVVLAAAALGLNRHATVWSVVIPTAWSGISTGLLLQTARALGETMAVMMVCGNIVQMPNSIFDPIRTLTANIALEMGYADERHRSVLFVSGLSLLVMVTVFVSVAEWTARRRGYGM